MEVIGKRFGSRVITHEAEPRVYKFEYVSKQRCFAWKCDCGQTGETLLVNLKRTKSCTHCAVRTTPDHNAKLYGGKSMRRWCEETGKNYNTVMTRIRRGMDWKEALRR